MPDRIYLMKRIISIYIIFAFILMSFVGCGKFREIMNKWCNKPETKQEQTLYSNGVLSSAESAEIQEWIGQEEREIEEAASDYQFYKRHKCDNAVQRSIYQINKKNGIIFILKSKT
jgi:hypothetical protein